MLIFNNIFHIYEPQIYYNIFHRCSYMNQNSPQPPPSQGATQPQEPFRTIPFPKYPSIKQLRKQLGKSKESDQAIQKTINDIIKDQKAILKANRLILLENNGNIPWNIEEKRRQVETQRKKQMQKQKQGEGMFGRIKLLFGFGRTPSTQSSYSQQSQIKTPVSYKATLKHENLQQSQLLVSLVQETELESKKNR